VSTLPQRSARPSGRVDSGAETVKVSPTPAPLKAPGVLSPDGATSVTSGRRLPRRQLLNLSADLSTREQVVLRDLAAYRFLSTGQLQRLHFTQHATEGAASCTGLLHA